MARFLSGRQHSGEPAKLLVILDRSLEQQGIESADLYAKIILALKIQDQDLARLTLEPPYEQPYVDIRKAAPFKNMLAFGVKPRQLMLQLEWRPNELIRFDGKGLIFTQALDELHGDPKLKKLLWGALQEIGF